MWQRLLQPEYLLEPVPGPPGQFRILYYFLALASIGSWLLALGLGRQNRVRRWQALLPSSLLTVPGLALIGCSFASVPYFSMRALVFGLNVAAILYPLTAAVFQAEPVVVWARHRLALLGQIGMSDPPLRLWTQVLLLLGHSLGLAVLAQHYVWQPWLLMLCAFLLAMQCWVAWRWRCLRVEYLAPLLLVYGLLFVRLLWIAVRLVLGRRGFRLPPALDACLDVNLALWLAVPWTIGLHCHAFLRQLRRERLLPVALGALALAATLAWAACTYLHNRTRGVTGSDPYCYAQMGVDLAQSGLPVHRFPLASVMSEWKVSPEAGVHLGYHLPFDAESHCATVWPVGHALFLAAGYRLLGEEGLYLVTPVMGWLALLALAGLGWELSRSLPTFERLCIVAVAVFLLATSYGQIERLVVPMADAAAQLLTILTIWLSVRALRADDLARQRIWAAIAGATFGLAYLVRHTQLVLGLAMAVLLAMDSTDKRQRMLTVLSFAAGALVFAVPDLLYHQWVMGNWLQPESLELRHFALRFMLPMAGRVLGDLLAAREFLYVAPIVVYGAVWAHSLDRRAWAALTAWVIGVLLIHLPYEALRLRDLLSLFPALCLWAGFGVARLWQRVRGWQAQLRAPAFIAGLISLWVLAGLLWLRTGSTLKLISVPDLNAFGRLNANQRAGFDRIAEDVPAGAWIGCSLNSGSIELHGQRTAFRPAVWQTPELYAFFDRALSQGVSLYVLDDALEMSEPLEAVRRRYHVWVGSMYDIPFYHTAGGSSGEMVRIYRVEAR